MWGIWLWHIWLHQSIWLIEWRTWLHEWRIYFNGRRGSGPALHSAIVLSGVDPCSCVAGGSRSSLALCDCVIGSGSLQLCCRGIEVERSDVDSLGSLSGKWAASDVARATSISSTCQPLGFSLSRVGDCVITTCILMLIELHYGELPGMPCCRTELSEPLACINQGMAGLPQVDVVWQVCLCCCCCKAVAV